MSRHYEKTSLFREAMDERELGLTRVLALGDEVRRELSVIWNLLVAPSSTGLDRKRTAELLEKWVPLLERPRFVAQIDNAPLLARFLRDIPADHAGLVGVLVRTLRACASARPLDAAVRQVLVVASRREPELGWNALVELIFLALPESMAELEQAMSSTVLSSAEVAQRHQRTLLALPFAAREVRRAAFRAFYFQPAAEFADRTLAELDEAPADVWEGVALAALARPRLQAHFIAALTRRPRPELREVVQLIATTGAFSVSADASRWLDAHPGPSPRSAGLPDPLPRTLPWSDEERSRIARYLREPLAAHARQRSEAARAALLRLCKLNTAPSSDLVSDALDLLAVHLEEAEVRAFFVELCVMTPQRSVLAKATAHLLERVGKHGPLEPKLRAQLASRAPEVVVAFDGGLALHRLALPLAIDGWLAGIAKLVPVTGVPFEDFELALSLARFEPAPLDALLGACTPNQRRLLVKQAPLAELDAAGLEVLVRSLTSTSPATLAVFCERLAEAGPLPERLAVLRGLTDKRLHEGVRRAAIAALGELGARAELELLGSLTDIDTREARARIVERLGEAGETFEAGSLALLSDEGRLALAAEPATEAHDDTPEERAWPELPKDRRLRLGPPPRRVPAHVTGTMLLFGPNAWSFFMAHGLAVAVVTGWPVGWRIALVLGFFLNHVLADTGRVLTLLRRGELLMASVRVHTTTSHGKHKTTTYHHTLTVLGDSGRTDEHVVRASSRLDELLDERLEPVLATFSPERRLASVWPIDRLDFVEVSDRGGWRISKTAWALLGVSLVGWGLYLVLGA